VNLVDNVERLRLDFEKILPLHGPGAAARADLYAAIGRPLPDIAKILNPPAPAAPAVGQRGQGGQRGQAPAVTADPAAALLSSVCSSCHNLLRVQNKKATEDEWAGTVERMKGKGAQLSDEETQSLIDYLAKTYK
jgi:cytochrome c5